MDRLGCFLARPEAEKPRAALRTLCPCSSPISGHSSHHFSPQTVRKHFNHQTCMKLARRNLPKLKRCLRACQGAAEARAGSRTLLRVRSLQACSSVRRGRISIRTHPEARRLSESFTSVGNPTISALRIRRKPSNKQAENPPHIHRPGVKLRPR